VSGAGLLGPGQHHLGMQLHEEIPRQSPARCVGTRTFGTSSAWYIAHHEAASEAAVGAAHNFRCLDMAY
jgi:hypothetical protein